jgi:hypothetical protein
LTHDEHDGFGLLILHSPEEEVFIAVREGIYLLVVFGSDCTLVPDSSSDSELVPCPKSGNMSWLPVLS